ncbi:multidrug ABC transporter ATP-binding protein [Anaplasma phagocytophilum str. Norway variant2]|uniref:Multidrug ABC transporter ATP-binding protein n=1 Tax=Anaplasma phagocytophilum str. Norway variant2 TaxID=1392507 RepID=A0A161I5C3_ANAPH|nr:ABC transporter transmembrane domain-containing protein [Anaplasma phagocytophilum]ANC33943.1 multidrug ABC transporter ATP-binding protein [Anaplasma phagocytophilum str. Norway variant2]
MRLLLSYIKPYKKYFLSAAAVVIISSGAILAFGRGLSALIDDGLFGGDAGVWPLIWVFLLTLVIATGSYLRLWLCGMGAEFVIRDLRRRLYDKIVSLSPSVLETTSTSLLMSRLMADTAALHSILSGSVLFIFRNITVFLSSVGMLIYTNFLLTVRIVWVVPLLLLIVAFLGRRVKRAGVFSRMRKDALAHFSEETCRGLKVIQSLVAEKRVQQKFSCLLEEVSDSESKYVVLRALLVTLIIASVAGSVGVVLWIGIKAVAEHDMSGGALLSFVFYSALAAGSVNGLGDNMHDLQKAVGISEDIDALLNMPSSINDASECKDVYEIKGSVDINDVTFAYAGKKEIPVLKGISLSMKKGEKIAIVGYSGSGKSTIVDLLLRFYDVGSGSITIDGVDIRQISLRSLRTLFCVVSQSPVIFSGTILDNITYGIHDYTEEQLNHAIEGASIADFINELPNKIHTFVGEKGVCLSEGQKQRIVVARTILRRPEVLILDEATSALDSDNEDKVYRALRELMRDKLTITVAHRLATIVDSDKIVVLHDGVIQEVGTHATLMQDDDSLYARLFKLQCKVGAGSTSI